jgi:hypothetical protein
MQIPKINWEALICGGIDPLRSKVIVTLIALIEPDIFILIYYRFPPPSPLAGEPCMVCHGVLIFNDAMRRRAIVPSCIG